MSDLSTESIESIGEYIVSIIIEEDLVDAKQEGLIVWSGRAHYVIGDRVIKNILDSFNKGHNKEQGGGV